MVLLIKKVLFYQKVAQFPEGSAHLSAHQESISAPRDTRLLKFQRAAEGQLANPAQQPEGLRLAHNAQLCPSKKILPAAHQPTDQHHPHAPELYFPIQ